MTNLTHEVRANQLGADDFICLPIPQADGTVTYAESDPFEMLDGKNVVVTDYETASSFVKNKINEFIESNRALSVKVQS